ncbi:MAG: transglycosylase SLT domain-containing protein [Saprospiraceae bacterium]|nr:transglycosylase SLT domain-containing protein [Saprospiraceae bacterium]
MKSEVVPPRYDIVVKSYLRTYLINNRPKAEEIVGRSVIYFPIFEKHLKEHNLPLDLKYLSVVESALSSKAVSRASAVGLWQFMAPTAKEYGLKINLYVDERCDPEKSTVAAMEYLGDLYKRFDDWSLALAAYNSGSGRVSRAIKRSRSKDFWRLRRYLPRETRNYVPAFIAATYLMHHYEDHDLTPAYPSLDLQITETIIVYDEFKFEELSQHTEIPIEVLESLNPVYRKGFIPADENGHSLTLPKRVMAAFKDYLESQRPDTRYTSIESSPILVTRTKEDLNANYIKYTHTVDEDETLERIARYYNCSVYQLKAWNQLKTSKILAGQKLLIYIPKELQKFRIKKLEPVALLPETPIPNLPLPETAIANLPAKEAFLMDRFVQYTVKRRERLRDIANRLPGVTLGDLEHLNQIPGKQMLKPGMIIRLKKM